MGFGGPSLEPMISAQEYFGFAISMTLAFGICFELPIVIVTLALLGLVTPQFLTKFRRHAIVVCVIIGAFLTPGDLVWTTIAMAVPALLAVRGERRADDRSSTAGGCAGRRHSRRRPRRDRTVDRVRTRARGSACARATDASADHAARRSIPRRHGDLARGACSRPRNPLDSARADSLTRRACSSSGPIPIRRWRRSSSARATRSRAIRARTRS